MNTVLNARSRTHFVKDFPGPLSIKTVVEGRVAWKTGNRSVWVDDSSFLVLNDGEPYSMAIDSPQAVGTRCVFFARGFVESLHLQVRGGERHCLEDTGVLDEEIPFLSRLHPRSENLMRLMARMVEQERTSAPAMEKEEGFVQLGYELLLQYAEVRKQLARIPAVRYATRTEILKRVARGREFLHAEAYGGVTLGAAARAACMSPFHFQRNFAKAFGTTPSRYVAGLRFARAARLLLSGLPVTDVCFALGFESLGSFSTAFRKHFSAPPRSFQP